MDQAMSDSNWYTASCNPQRPSESPQVHQEQKLLESITRQTEKLPCLSLKPSGRKRSIFTLPPKRSNIGTKLFPHQLQSFSPCWSGVWVSGGWSKLNLWSGVKWIGEDLILSISHSGHLVFVSGWTKATQKHHVRHPLVWWGYWSGCLVLMMKTKSVRLVCFSPCM